MHVLSTSQILRAFQLRPPHFALCQAFLPLGIYHEQLLKPVKPHLHPDFQSRSVPLVWVCEEFSSRSRSSPPSCRCCEQCYMLRRPLSGCCSVMICGRLSRAPFLTGYQVALQKARTTAPTSLPLTGDGQVRPCCLNNSYSRFLFPRSHHFSDFCLQRSCFLTDPKPFSFPNGFQSAGVRAPARGLLLARIQEARMLTGAWNCAHQLDVAALHADGSCKPSQHWVWNILCGTRENSEI